MARTDKTKKHNTNPTTTSNESCLSRRCMAAEWIQLPKVPAGRPGGESDRRLRRGSLQSPQVVLTETLLQREKVGDIHQQGGPGQGSLSPLKTKSFGFLSSFNEVDGRQRCCHWNQSDLKKHLFSNTDTAFFSLFVCLPLLKRRFVVCCFGNVERLARWLVNTFATRQRKG